MAIEKKTIPSRLNDALRHSSVVAGLSLVLRNTENYRRFLSNFFVFGFLFSLFARGFTSIYDFVKAKNKNLFELPKLGVGLISTAYAIAFIAVVITQPFTGLGGITFILLSAYGLFGLETLYQLGGLCYNLAKGLLAPANSIERTHHLQAAFKNFNTMAISMLILGLVVFAEAAPILGPIAIAALSLTAVTLVWDLVPPLRKWIKTQLHIDKPEIDMNFKKDLDAQIDPTPRNEADKLKEAKHHKSFLWGRAYRKAMVVDYLKAHRPDAALAYLNEELDNKIRGYDALTSPGNKQIAKNATLTNAKRILNNVDGKVGEIQELMDHAFSEVHQSFFYDTSDTDDLLEAIRTYMQHKPLTHAPLANQIANANLGKFAQLV